MSETTNNVKDANDVPIVPGARVVLLDDDRDWRGRVGYVLRVGPRPGGPIGVQVADSLTLEDMEWGTWSAARDVAVV